MAEPLAALAKLGTQNTVLAVQPLYRAKQLSNDSAPEAAFVRYASFPGGMGLATAGAFLFARIVASLRILHREHAIDVVHAHGPLPCGHAAMLLARELKIPFVVSVHGLDAYSTRQVHGWAGEWCRRLSTKVFHSARNLICISEHVREQVLAGTRASTTVIYNGVDPEMFSPGADSAATPVSVLSIGNLIPTKGHELLLRAFAAATATQPDARVDVVGTGPEKARLEAMASELMIADRVRFLGRVSRREVARLLRECTLFALPSSYEGLGCVYLEAMSSGKVAIGCRGQGIEEVVDHGKNGWLIDPGKVEQLTIGLSTLLANSALREHIGSQARQKILTGLTLQDQARGLAHVYQESLA